MCKRAFCLLLCLCMALSAAPARAGGPGRAQTIAAGSDHSLAVKTDGSLWAWGDNRYGQLGDGTMEEKMNPTKIMDGVTSASAGYNHSLAVKADGSLWAWGSNEFGELGCGFGRNICKPVKVMDGVVSVSAGSWHSLAVKSDGSLWSWGRNSYGQLGDGTTKAKEKPVKIMDGVTAASAGVNYSMALKSDGSLWAWGSNEYGQLGDGSNADKKSPVKVLSGVLPPSQSPSERPPYTPPEIVSIGALPQASGQAMENPTSVLVDGEKKIFQFYALWNDAGRTNYVKIRDLAYFLDGTDAQFNVGWNGSINLELGEPYTSRNGQENNTPYTGYRYYEKYSAPINIEGVPVPLQAFTLFDDSGGASTYFQLRDLGQAIGFNVGFNTSTGVVFIETDKPYDPKD